MLKRAGATDGKAQATQLVMIACCFHLANKHSNSHSLVPAVVSQPAVPQRVLMSTTLAENFSFPQARQPRNLR